jgi:16S rRNA G1207 methylase RsmC
MADLCVAWGAAQPIHLSVSYNLNSTLQWTSSAMETVLNDWTATATENRKHFTELLQRTAVQVGWRTTIAAERRAGVAPLELRLLVLTSQKLLPPCRW